MPSAPPPAPDGRLVPVHDTHLFIVERGPAEALPVLVLGGDANPELADALDSLTTRYRLVLVDLRAQGRSAQDSDPHSWTLSQHASDVSAVAAAIGVERYAVLGHGSGAPVARQHATDAPGAAVATVISSDDAAEPPQPGQPLLTLTGQANEQWVQAVGDFLDRATA